MTRLVPRILRLGGCLLAVTLAAAASAATLTVGPAGSGDDLTIQAACRRAVAGDEIVVLPGVYLENIILTSGVRVISRDGPEHTIVDGQGQKCFMAQQCAPGTAVTGFTVTNGGSFNGGGFWIYDNSTLEIAHNIIRNHHTDYEGAGVLVNRYSYADIHDNSFLENRSHLTAVITVIVYSSADVRNNEFINNQSEAHSAAIGVHESHVEIVGNLFQDNSGAGDAGTVDFYKATGLVSNNVFLGNIGSVDGASGVAVRNKDSRVTVLRNIFSTNRGGPALRTEACQAVSCNIFWNNDVDHAGLCLPIGKDGNINVDPGLCAEHANHVQDGSPSLNSRCGHIGLATGAGCGD